MERNQHLLYHTVLSVHLSVRQCSASCSLLMSTLQIRTLRLREVNELAESNTVKKLTPAEVRLLPKLPRWGGVG